MHCFLQLKRENSSMGGILTDTTINVAHIIRIEPNPLNDGTCITYSSDGQEKQIHTQTQYDEIIETLTGFRKVEVIQIL